MKANMIAVVAIWAIVCSTGAFKLYDYQSRPGAAGNPARQWPSSSLIARDALQPNLVMFLHPKCSCSSASLAELARLLRFFPDLVHTTVVFDSPSEKGIEWAQSGLWQKAHAIQGVSVMLDTDGNERRQFGAETSGHVLLYASDGALQFSGGITAARGHEGKSSGRSALEMLLADQKAQTDSAHVFGCGIG